MNRAFLMIVGPALFVALLFLALGWGLRVPLEPAVVLLGVAAVALAWRAVRRKPGSL